MSNASTTVKIRRKTNPVLEGIQFNGKNSTAVAGFVKGVLGEEHDAVVKAGGSYVSITWGNTTKTVIRKGFWAVDAETGLIEIYTDADFKSIYKEVAK